MARIALYLVETPIGPLRLLAARSDATHSIGAETRVAYKPENTLVFDRQSERLMPDVRVGLAAAAAA